MPELTLSMNLCTLVVEREYLSLFMCLFGFEETVCLACFYLLPSGDASEESTETIAPFLTIVGVDTTFVSRVDISQMNLLRVHCHRMLTLFL
jgi:hypothetical protein